MNLDVDPLPLASLPFSPPPSPPPPPSSSSSLSSSSSSVVAVLAARRRMKEEEKVEKDDEVREGRERGGRRGSSLIRRRRMRNKRNDEHKSLVGCLSGVVLESSRSVWGGILGRRRRMRRASKKARGLLNAFSEPLGISLGRFLEAFWDVWGVS